MYHPRFKGAHYDIGLKYGKLLKKNSVDLFGLTELDNFQFDHGIQSERILREFFPKACEEIQGLAEGIEVPYERFSAWLLCISVCMEIQGCSMIAFRENGRIVFGRNNDLPPIFRKISSSCFYRPSGGYSFIANSSAFVCAEDGMNEKGLAAGMTYVWAKESAPGFSSMFLVRYLLENCATVEEGLRAIQDIPAGGAYHLMLADRDEIAHAECCPQKIQIHRGKSAAASNHFVSDAMKPYEQSRNLYFSHERYTTGRSALNTQSRKDPVEYAKDVLAGRLGFMCQYPGKLNFDTVWSSVYDLSEKAVYRAEGNPARALFKKDARGFQ